MPGGARHAEEHLARQRLLLLNEAGARIGTTLDVTRTAQELADVAVPRLADFVTVDLLDAVRCAATSRRPARPTGPSPCAAPPQRSVLDGSPEAVVARGGESTRYPASSPLAQCLADGPGALYEASRPGHRPVGRPRTPSAPPGSASSGSTR